MLSFGGALGIEGAATARHALRWAKLIDLGERSTGGLSQIGLAVEVDFGRDLH